MLHKHNLQKDPLKKGEERGMTSIPTTNAILLVHKKHNHYKQIKHE